MKNILGCLLLAGCVTSPGVANMSPEQLKAMSSAHACTVVCSTVQGPFEGSSKFVFASCDKAATINDGVAVDANCKISIMSVAEPVKK